MDFYDRPDLIAGHRFKFVSGDIILQGFEGKVVRVEPSPNAVGRIGRVVVLDVDGLEGLRKVRWSYFRNNAEVDD